MCLINFPGDVCPVLKSEQGREIPLCLHRFSGFYSQKQPLPLTNTIIKNNILRKIPLSHIQISIETIKLSIRIFKRYIDNMLGIIKSINVDAEIYAATDFFIYFAEFNLLKTVVQCVYKFATIYISVFVSDVVSN